VLAAKEICARLRLHGFWADFMNPFSGKPFYSYSSGKKLYKIDDRFRGLGIRFENLNNCLIIEPNDATIFTGNIFTTGPNDMKSMKALLADDADL
jgi:Methylmalonic aciduria and homocystinuria type D protein